MYDTNNFGLPSNTPDTDGDGEYDFRDTDNVIPLPIQLLSFSVEIDLGKVNINWVTSSEINNAYFTIERSENGVDWHKLTIVEGAGNSNSARSYRTTDSSPLYGTSYYRLKQTDFDGRSEYLSVKSIVLYKEASEQVEVYPNPTEGELKIVCNDLGFDEVRILNLLGQDVSGLTKKNRVNDSTLTVDLSLLSEGFYYVITRDTPHKVYKQ
jgi:hypothetical protein